MIGQEPQVGAADAERRNCAIQTDPEQPVEGAIVTRGLARLRGERGLRVAVGESRT